MQQISLFYGEEDFLLNEELKKLKNKVAFDFNYERLNGRKDPLEKIISAINSIPMMGGDRVIVIDELDLEDDEEAKLFETLKNVPQGVHVVFVNQNVDKRRKFYKFLEKTGEVREFKKLSEWEQDKGLAFIFNAAKGFNKKISGKAASLLIEIVGLSLRMLFKEIEKISTFIGDRGQIEEDDVSHLASSGEKDSFALSNAAQRKDVPSAVVSLENLLRDNADPHMIIGMLAKQYRTLLQVKSLEEKGLGQSEIAAQLRAKPYFVKKCMEKTSLFTNKELADNLRKLHDTDLKIKSGYPPRFSLEMLIPEIVRGR